MGVWAGSGKKRVPLVGDCACRSLHDGTAQRDDEGRTAESVPTVLGHLDMAGDILDRLVSRQP
jgi:hypothetical protein